MTHRRTGICPVAARSIAACDLSLVGSPASWQEAQGSSRDAGDAACAPTAPATHRAVDLVIEPLALENVSARHLVEAPAPAVVALPLPGVLQSARERARGSGSASGCFVPSPRHCVDQRGKHRVARWRAPRLPCRRWDRWRCPALRLCHQPAPQRKGSAEITAGACRQTSLIAITSDISMLSAISSSAACVASEKHGFRHCPHPATLVRETGGEDSPPLSVPEVVPPGSVCGSSGTAAQ